MRKPIPTTVHGVLDYMTAGLLFALPRVLGWGKCATRVFDIAGSGAVAYSLMTKYELGVVKVLPMKAHLALDSMSGAALIGAAALMDEEDADVRATIAGMGAFEIAASLMSQSTPRYGRGGATFESGQQMFADSGERREAPQQQSMPVSPRRFNDDDMTSGGDTNVARTATI
jgi:hypothetical protein